MPSIVTQAERKRLHREGHGVPQDHMLREMAETIETLSIERPFLLVLEDVHWSDYATLDLLALLARRREAARVFVIATYRPYETNGSTHPLKLLKHELVAHGRGEELSLDFLSHAEISEYLALRFPQSEFASALAHVIHQRSEGNPLFMVNMTEYLIGHGVLRQEEGQWNLQEEPHHIAMGVPTNLQEMIEAQIDRLNQEQQHLLEAASVAGRQFSAAVLAVGLTQDVVTVEDHCTQLVRHTHFLQPCGESTWPNGTFSTQYRFVHSFYQQVLYDRIPSGRRAALHHRIGQQLELAYGPQVNHVATELAMHFERGRDYSRALRYRRTAAEQALRQYAYREALSHLTVALELLKTEPATAEREQQEITLSCTLGTTLAALHGYASPMVERAYARARALCQHAHTTAQLFPVVRGLWSFYIVRADFLTARVLAEQLTQFAQQEDDPATLLEAHRALGYTLYLVGELDTARQHLQQSLDFYNPQVHGAHALLYGQDPGVICRSHFALVLLLLGYPDRALQHSTTALALAKEQRHPYTLALAYYHAAVLHQSLRDPQQTYELTAAMIALSQEHGFAYCLAGGVFLQGWALTVLGQEKEGVRLMLNGISAYDTTGSAIAQPYFRALLAEAYGKHGQLKKGLQCIEDAFAAVRDLAHYIYAPELYRIHGELLQNNRRASQARNGSTESCFQQALAVARTQGAKFFELRTLVSKSQCVSPQDRQRDTQQELAAVYHWFHEGADTTDLRAARALLADLA
jgi:predicted ATPase